MANIITTLSLEMSENWYVSKKLSGVGRVGENTVTKLIIEPTEILDATYELEIMSADGSKNVAELTVEDNTLYLILTANMLTVGGITKMQLRAVFADNSIKKSNIFELKVSRSISATDYYEEYSVTIFDQLVAQCQDIAGDAEGYCERAETAAENAEDYSESASASATAASNSADAAHTSETNASNSANAASTSAGNAHDYELNAKSYSESASSSATNASTSETNAHDYELSAKGYSEAASTSATNASTSETNARNSATAAHDSEVNAASSENNASTYAGNAYNSAQNAATSATNAHNSETAAGNSATAANTSATNAHTSETNAANSATAAGNSATAAGNSATAAGTSETNASTSATTATNAATTATNAANSVLASANQINSNTKRIENLEAINKGITYVENVQSGTANAMTISASNIGAYAALNYIGGMSKKSPNLFNTATANVGKGLAADGELGTNSVITVSDYIPISPSTAYYFSNVVQASTGRQIAYYDSNKTFISIDFNTTNTSFAKTTPSNAYFMRVAFFTETYATNGQVEVGAAATPYMAYGTIWHAPVTSITSGTDTFAIPSDVQNLSGYGLGVDSTYYNYIDFGEMKFKNNVGIVDLGDLTWTNEESDLGAGRFSASFTDYTPKLLVAPICSAYTGIASSSASDLVNGDIAITNTEESPLLRIFDTSKAGYTAEQIKTALSGVCMIYALNTNGQTETDVSSYFADNFIKVSAGGTVTFVNEHNLAVPYSLTTNDSV